MTAHNSINQASRWHDAGEQQQAEAAGCVFDDTETGARFESPAIVEFAAQDKRRGAAFESIRAAGDVCKHYAGEVDCTRSVIGAHAHVAGQDIVELQPARTSYQDEIASIETLVNRPVIAGGAPTVIRPCACSATHPDHEYHDSHCDRRTSDCCGVCDKRWEWEVESGSTDLVYETRTGETYRIRWEADRPAGRWVAECDRGAIGLGYHALVYAMDACSRTARQATVAHTWPMASPVLAGGSADCPDEELVGWGAIADREVRLEVVHVDGPALVLRAAWREPYAGRMGWPTKPAFFLLACTQCWALVNGNGYPQLEAKISNARKHCGLLDHQRAPEAERNTA